ncbi:protein rep [Nocardia higoensis]|uniref:Protein rep n=1 Tax=Nocardia higoensis TaxID=228599 RepID=A0ABS0DJ29_9NOCA|nr:protein rep [Nocardia higoensis]MBF6358466.1 protein rep [Nocardia higoensis]
MTVKRSITGEGMALAGFGGIETCGRIWLCPVCSAKIRLRRGDEIARGVANHFGTGGSALFATATLSHEHGDELLVTFDVVAKAWRYVTNSRAWKTARERYGIVGTIKAVECTHGDNGWHPHAHIVVLLSQPLDTPAVFALWQSLDAAWAQGLARQGWPTGLTPYRFRLDAVQLDDSGVGLAAYVAKVQDKGLGNEIARADLKKGRSGSRSPFEILSDFGENALADDLELWWEYEHATKGRSAIRWSRGLRALILPNEKELTDEEIAAEDVGGELVAVLSRSLWARLREHPDVVADALAAVELLGWQGLIMVLTRHRIGLSGLYTPDEWETPGAVDLSA